MTWDEFRRTTRPLDSGKDRIQNDPPSTRIALKPRPITTQEPSRSLGLHAYQPRDVRLIHTDAKLDLHGYRKSDAYHRTQRFLARAYAKQYRWVLIITGKGEEGNPQTLRNQLPLWLAEWAAWVSGYGQAPDARGGKGAWYVRIRVVRDMDTFS